MWRWFSTPVRIRVRDGRHSGNYSRLAPWQYRPTLRAQRRPSPLTLPKERFTEFSPTVSDPSPPRLPLVVRRHSGRGEDSPWTWPLRSGPPSRAAHEAVSSQRRHILGLADSHSGGSVLMRRFHPRHRHRHHMLACFVLRYHRGSTALGAVLGHPGRVVRDNSRDGRPCPQPGGSMACIAVVGPPRCPDSRLPSASTPITSGRNADAHP